MAQLRDNCAFPAETFHLSGSQGAAATQRMINVVHLAGFSQLW